MALLVSIFDTLHKNHSDVEGMQVGNSESNVNEPAQLQLELNLLMRLGELDPEEVAAALAKMIHGEELAPHARKLPTRDQQLSRLSELNEEIWGDTWLADQLGKLNSRGRYHVQRLDDFEALYVSFEEESIEKWGAAMTTPRSQGGLGYASADLGVFWRHESTFDYRRGSIHRVRFNLLAMRYHDKGVSPAAAREEALATNQVLAQFELVAALALSPELSQGTGALPYFCLPGIVGEADEAPYFRREGGQLTTALAEFDHRGTWSVPVILDSQRVV